MSSIKNKKLLKKDPFLEIFKKIDEIEFYYETDKALDILNKLENLQKNRKKDLSDEEGYIYRKIIARLKFILLISVSEDDLFELFRDFLKIGLEMNHIDIVDHLKKRISFVFIDERKKLKNKIKKILEVNNEVLTKKKLVINDNISMPTTANWLKDYMVYAGSRVVESVKRVQYLTTSDNVKKAGGKEREKIKKLIELYEYLKLSPFDLDGNEDNLAILKDGKITVFSNGRPISINKADKIQKSLKMEITDKERKEYREEKVEKLEKDFSDDFKKKAIEEEVLGKKDFSHLEEEKNKLKKMLDQYKENSLERKAVEEELDKILK